MSSLDLQQAPPTAKLKVCGYCMRSSARRTTVAIEHQADRTVSATPVSILLPVHLRSTFFSRERCEWLFKPKLSVLLCLSLSTKSKPDAYVKMSWPYAYSPSASASFQPAPAPGLLPPSNRCTVDVQFSPERTTALAEPDVQLLEGMEHAVLSIEPDSSPAVLHVLFDDAFLPARGHVAEVRIEQIVRAHHGKPGVDRAAFPFFDLVDSRFHFVVDAATWHATQRSKRTGMGIKKHLVGLAGVRNQPECATGAQLHVGDLDTSKQATDQRAFFAPVKLKGLTEGKSQRYKSAYRLALLAPPRADKRRELAVTAVITLGLDLLEKCFGAPAVVFWPERIGLERLFQRLVEMAEFVEGCAPLVRWLSGFGRSDPFTDGVSRKPGTLGYLMQRELVAEIHPPDFSQHFHADHPVFSCSKSEQKQLNTWVSFQSAEQPLLGQFSVSDNIPGGAHGEGYMGGSG